MKWLITAAIVAAMLLSAMVGKVTLDPAQMLTPGTTAFTILTQLRLPRVLLAFFSGGILALSGLLFQTLFRNPLTTPFTLGISSGATLGAATAIMLGLENGVAGFSFVTLLGFVGALGTVAMIYLFSRKLPSTGDQRLILVGIALSFLYSALLMLIYYLSDFQESYRIMRFTMGTLLTVGYGDILPVFLAALLILWVAQRHIEALKRFAISDSFAFLHGVEVERVTIILFVVISIGVGVLVSITGTIGFVGLIIPHIVRMVLKSAIERTILPVFVTGGLFLLLCDTISRILPTASEMPVGVVTSLIGGVVFVWILIGGKR